MTTNEIKKALYKNKPIAYLKASESSEDKYVYYAQLLNSEVVRFDIPLTDMGNEKFTVTMPAQLLIRWITTKTK